jgi:hypothetical protein
MFINNILFGKIIGYGSFMIALCIYYWKTSSSSVTFNKIMYAVFVLSIIGDLMVFHEWGEIGQIIQLVLNICVNLLYMRVFRKERTFFAPDGTHDLPKILIPSLIVLLFFGFFLLKTLSDLLYFPVLIYALIEIFFGILAFYRPFVGINYYFVIIGATLKILADCSYSLYFYSNTYIFGIINILLYPISIYLIITGFIKSHSLEFEISIKKYKTKSTLNKSFLSFNRIFKITSNFISIYFT